MLVIVVERELSDNGKVGFWADESGSGGTSVLSFVCRVLSLRRMGSSSGFTWGIALGNKLLFNDESFKDGGTQGKVNDCSRKGVRVLIDFVSCELDSKNAIGLSLWDVVESSLDCLFFVWNLVGFTLPALLDLGMTSVANADSCKNLGFDGE